MSRQIAQEIINRRPIKTTSELRDAVENVVKGRFSIKSVARVFQGIRIEVNREIEVLKSALEDSLKLLKVGGRIVAISYHSLEDRLVKHFFKSGNFEGKIEKDFYGKSLNPIEPLVKQIITPGEDEIERNPASRSAKMRIAEKIKEVN
jgi:16S rRNA (cytosine1402-N4)-methyltransferase